MKTPPSWTFLLVGRDVAYGIFLWHPALVLAGSSFYHMFWVDQRPILIQHRGWAVEKTRTRLSHITSSSWIRVDVRGDQASRNQKISNYLTEKLEVKVPTSVLDITHALPAQVFDQRECQERMLLNSMNNSTLWISILLHQYIPSTMHLATLVCFCISTASAVKHYGLAPAMDVQDVSLSSPGARSDNSTSVYVEDMLGSACW